MNRMGHTGRRDSNQAEVIEELRKAGISAISLASVGDGCPDILAGFRGITMILECKDGSKPPSARALTAAEREFHATWNGQVAVVNSPEEAVIAVTEHVKSLGLV